MKTQKLFDILMYLSTIGLFLWFIKILSTIELIIIIIWEILYFTYVITSHLTKEKRKNDKKI